MEEATMKDRTIGGPGTEQPAGALAYNRLMSLIATADPRELDFLAATAAKLRGERDFAAGMTSAQQGQALDPAIDKSWTPGPVRRRGEITLDNIEQAFTYHAWDAGQVEQGKQVVEACVALGRVILRVVPDGPDRSVALRKLRELRMDLNSAITHFGQF